jgi:hypothetical protein
MTYSLAVTSCQRHDLLRKTLESFSAMVDIRPVETIIIEDSAASQPSWLDSIRKLGKITWISNGKRRGQVYSIDRLYDHITTPYIFHCEDDWQFIKAGFIQPSLDILDTFSNVWTVSLRGDEPRYHPNIVDSTLGNIQQPYWRNGWGGCTWNPGLRRLSDWKRIGCYGKIMGYGVGGIVPEQTLSKMHLDMGYRIAAIDRYVQHIGEMRSKAIEPLPTPSKVLIAIAACHAYDYGNHACGITRITEGRIDAQRETWIRDLAPFACYVDYKFFFGRSPDNRKPKADEVFLDVPDDYEHLPQKMNAIYRWALANGFEYLYKCDDDTLVDVPRLMREPYDSYDQLGFSNCSHGLNSRKCSCYITGGAGYWLSARAMRVAISAPALPLSNPHRWAEDYTTGMALRGSGLVRQGSDKYLPGFAAHYVSFPLPEGTVAAHAVKPVDMRRWHKGEL